MILSILVCSITERQSLRQMLHDVFAPQLSKYERLVEVLYEVDNREMSVGLKRQKLLERAIGKWVVFFDDDDLPSYNYIELIVEAINKNPNADCLGIRGLMTTNGKNNKTWCHRLGYPIEGDGKVPTKEGYDYIRPIIHFNPVLREKALQAGFKDMRYGEDMDYASRLNPLLKNEYFIDEILFHYRYSDLIPHHQKYGL